MNDKAHRLECLLRFSHAVTAYRRGDKAVVIAYLNRIAAASNADVAAIAKRELLAFAKSGKPVPG